MRGNFTGTRSGGSSSGGTLGVRSGSSGGSGGVDMHNFYKLSPKARLEKMMWVKNEERIQKTMEKMAASKGKENSKQVQQFMEQQKAKRARKQAKKEKSKEMVVRALNFSGGRVDAKGNIFDGSGKVVGKVNLETKEISVGFNKFGKFKDTPSGIYALELAMKKLQTTQKPDDKWGFKSLYGDIGGLLGDIGNLLGPKNNN